MEFGSVDAVHDPHLYLYMVLTVFRLRLLQIWVVHIYIPCLQGGDPSSYFGVIAEQFVNLQLIAIG